MPRRPLLCVAAAWSVLALLAGCSSSGPAADPGGAGGSAATKATSKKSPTAAAAAGSAGSSTSGKASAASVRYGNFFIYKGVAGPALDIYEGQPGQASTILVHDLAYGAISDYVHPHVQPGTATPGFAGQAEPTFAIPTGEDPKAHAGDAHLLTSYGIATASASVTLPLTGSSLTDQPGPLGGLMTGIRVERGSFNGQTTQDIPAAGTSELLADDSSLTYLTPVIGVSYLVIDNSCAKATNAASTAPSGPAIVKTSNATAGKYLFGVFPTAAGSHQVSVAVNGDNAFSSCAALARQGTTTVTVAAGQQTEVWVYGTSATALHVVAAPVGS